MTGAVSVGIVVGSESDLPVMNTCGEVLDGYGIGWEIGVMSAHRAGDVVRAYALAAPDRGLHVLIAGAGAAAHLPGVLASLTRSTARIVRRMSTCSWRRARARLD